MRFLPAVPFPFAKPIQSSQRLASTNLKTRHPLLTWDGTSPAAHCQLQHANLRGTRSNFVARRLMAGSLESSTPRP